ncbi:hypothetical protein E3P99_00910 [Wallemia hederae]|uniref:Uncharacterized protein n=1 Tax=Wallemia hederae TaxID=1540922 RepID=A0A4T0FTB7_9BASI|nr:hypothetical protein E3P99_00910 [Wallemia hederae]
MYTQYEHEARFQHDSMSYNPKAALAKVDEIIEANKRAYENRMGKGLGLGFEIRDYDMKQSVSQVQEVEPTFNDISMTSSANQDRSMSADSVPTLISDSEASFSADESLAITPEKQAVHTIRAVEKKLPVTVSLHPDIETRSSDSDDGDDKEELLKDDDEVLDGHDLANFYRSHSRQTAPTSPTPVKSRPFEREQDDTTEEKQEEQSNSIYTSFVAARRSKWLDKKATITRSLSIQTPSKPTTIEQSKPVKVTIEEEDEEEAEGDNLNWLVPLIQQSNPAKKNRPPPIWAQYAKVKGLTTDDNSRASRDVHSVLDRPRPRTSSYAFGSGTVKTDTSRKCSEKTSVVAMKKTPRKPDARNLFKSKDEELPFPSSYASLPMGPMPSLDRQSSSSTSAFERLPKDVKRSVTPTEIIKKRVSSADPTVRLVGYKHGVELSRNSSTTTMPLVPESQALRDLENMLVAYTEDEVLMRLSNMFQV